MRILPPLLHLFIKMELTLKFVASGGVLIIALILCSLLAVLKAGVVSNYNVDENCPKDLILYELRMTDCNEIPCRIVRERKYTIAADISPLRNMTAPTLKCGTVYLGRHVDWKSDFCDSLVNGTCPMVIGENYTTSSIIKIPYYVPPTSYSAYCNLMDDNEENTLCIWGTAKVV